MSELKEAVMVDAKPTPSQVAECNDMRQLCDWAAQYCMEWQLIEDKEYGAPSVWQNKKTGEHIIYEQWQPTSPTDIGKAQCLDLMVDFNIIRAYEDYDNLGFHYTSNHKKSEGFKPHIWEWEDGVEQGPQVCMVKAVIISVIED